MIKYFLISLFVHKFDLFVMIPSTLQKYKISKPHTPCIFVFQIPFLSVNFYQGFIRQKCDKDICERFQRILGLFVKEVFVLPELNVKRNITLSLLSSTNIYLDDPPNLHTILSSTILILKGYNFQVQQRGQGNCSTITFHKEHKKKYFLVSLLDNFTNQICDMNVKQCQVIFCKLLLIGIGIFIFLVQKVFDGEALSWFQAIFVLIMKSALLGSIVSDVLLQG
eukprot:TRINITY_DN8081_c0_g1_i8.p1 TRINITY_DN8081_c0_g1~~TRINITY_DN8081_c0_g1_i8.p1  ORF type:complete len:223 (-),score=-7.24 TRINITY_DN8081_c0_g1_i8:228-896(-)